MWCMAAMAWVSPLQITFEPDSCGLNFRVFMSTSENRQSFKLAKLSRYTVYIYNENLMYNIVEH